MDNSKKHASEKPFQGDRSARPLAIHGGLVELGNPGFGASGPRLLEGDWPCGSGSSRLGLLKPPAKPQLASQNIFQGDHSARPLDAQDGLVELMRLR
jgi:hypothetical protein